MNITHRYKKITKEKQIEKKIGGGNSFDQSQCKKRFLGISVINIAFTVLQLYQFLSNLAILPANYQLISQTQLSMFESKKIQREYLQIEIITFLNQKTFTFQTRNVYILYFKMNIQTFHSIQTNQADQRQEKRRINYIPGEKTGKWEDLEQMRYIVFLDFNKQLMRSKEKRSSNKFYQEMADFIGTRNALQCRSHHQKLEQKYIHFTKIIKRFKKSFDKCIYRQNIANLQQINKNKPQQQVKSKKYNEQLGINQNIQVEVQTDLFGLEKRFMVINHREVKIQEPEHALNNFRDFNSYYHGQNMMYNGYPHFYQPSFNPYYPIGIYYSNMGSP